MGSDMKGREMILKARFLRMAAAVFAVVGLAVFLVLYAQNIDGSVFSAMTDPFIITIILIPFLPSAVLSWMARRLERQYLKSKKGN